MPTPFSHPGQKSSPSPHEQDAIWGGMVAFYLNGFTWLRDDEWRYFLMEEDNVGFPEDAPIVLRRVAVRQCKKRDGESLDEWEARLHAEENRLRRLRRDVWSRRPPMQTQFRDPALPIGGVKRGDFNKRLRDLVKHGRALYRPENAVGAREGGFYRPVLWPPRSPSQVKDLLTREEPEEPDLDHPFVQQFGSLARHGLLPHIFPPATYGMRHDLTEHEQRLVNRAGDVAALLFEFLQVVHARGGHGHVPFVLTAQEEEERREPNLLDYPAFRESMAAAARFVSDVRGYLRRVPPFLVAWEGRGDWRGDPRVLDDAAYREFIERASEQLKDVFPALATAIHGERDVEEGETEPE